MKPARPDPAWDKAIADLCAWLKPRVLQAHTKIKGGSLIIVKRKRKMPR